MSAVNPDDLLRVTLASIGDALVTTDADGRVTYLNPVAEELTGRTNDDARGRPLADVFRILNEFSRAAVDGPAERALREGVAVRLADHTLLTARDGTERPIDASAAPIRDADGATVGVVLVFRDVTERRDRERALAASEARKAAVFEAALDGIVTIDHAGDVLEWNPAAERIFGFTADEARGRELAELIVPPAFRDAHRRGLAHYLETGEGPVLNRRLELSAVRKDGTEFPVELSITPIGGDGPPTFIGSIRDIGDRVRAAADLRASEERGRLALDSADLGAWNIDPADESLTTDARFRTIVHGTPAPLSYEQAFARIHPDDRDRVREAVAAATDPEHPVPYAVEYRVVHPDGTVRRVSAKGRANFTGEDDARSLSSFDGTVADVTDRHRTLEAVRESERRFAAAVRAVSSLIWTNDPEGKMRGGQPGWSAFTGQTRDEYEGYGWSNAVHPEDARPTIDAWEEAVAEKRTFEFEHRLRRHDGEYRTCTIRAVPVLDGAGEIREWVGVHTDVTEQRRAEAALRENEAKFRLMADSIPQLAWTAGPDGHIDWYNRRWYEYTGTTPEQMEGWGWQSVHEPNTLPRVLESWRRSLDRGEPFEMVFPLRAADGTYRPFLTRCNPLRGEDGAVLAWFGTNTDVSEQERTQQELRRVAAQLSEADRRKDEFLATLAHELRNPLAPIRSGLEVLRLGGDDAAAVAAVRETMERQAAQMTRLIDDLLDVSRITRGKLILRRERVELADVVRSAVEAVRPAVDGAGHDLTVSLPDDPVVLDADAARLAQVFTNLLGNAAKYTPPGGRITLSATVDDGDEPGLELRVRDSGPGIPASKRETVFGMFTQLDRDAGEDGYSGLGIGLTMVQSLVEMHGGTVSCERPESGTGGDFRVRLPLPAAAPPADPAVPGADVPDAAPAARHRVLVVDDNTAAAKMLAMLVRMRGHEVRTAHDGLEAVAAAEEFRPALVLMDLGMPNLNGYEAARRIRERRWGADMTLVALTGWGQDEDRRRTAEAGFDRHLVKPAEPAALQEVLAGLDAPP